MPRSLRVEQGKKKKDAVADKKHGCPELPEVELRVKEKGHSGNCQDLENWGSKDTFTHASESSHVAVIL